MNATERLLVALADPEGRTPKPAIDGVDWETFDALALKHGVYPCIAQNNRRARILPEPLAAKAEEDNERTFARAHFYLRLAHTYLTLLQDNGVEALLLKGPAIAFHLYPAPELRPFGDLDLFIRQSDNVKVKELLNARGLPLNKPELERFNLENKSQFKFIDGENGIVIEVHWNFVNSRSLHTGLRLDENAIWNTRRVLSLEGLSIPTLSPAYTFVQISVHQTFQHQFEKLRWLIDLLQLVRKERSPKFWDAVEDCLAGSSGARTAAHACLQFLNYFYPDTVDDAVLNRFRPSSLRATVLKGMLQPGSLFTAPGRALTVRRKAFRQALKY